MTLALRCTVFLDGKRRTDDYEVRHDGRTVGRIYRMRSTGRELWRWTQSGIFQLSHGPNGSVADSLDEAKAAFRRRGSGGLDRRYASGEPVVASVRFPQKKQTRNARVDPVC
jgi:hypothetical protein